jgi:hypothetical protein
MPFPEAIKLVVRQRAHFACCICHAVGVEIHHIEPQAEGGPDAEENGAPLCPSCHEIYGANPTKRKFIREARDHWYSLCANRYASDASRLEAMHDLLKNLPTKTDIGEMITAAGIASDYSMLSATPEDSPDSALLSQPITALSLKAYLRWLHRSVRHCGASMLDELHASIIASGYRSVEELHATLGRTKEVVADFFADKRDDGMSMDHVTDAAMAQLFLGIFDEIYCRENYPNAYASAQLRGHAWARTLPLQEKSSA